MDDDLAKTPTTDEAETARVRRWYDRNAASYDRKEESGRWVRDARAWVAGGATGRTLEVGIGSGRNLRHYPPDVELVGIELSPAMLEIARRRAAEVGSGVDLRRGDAQALDLPDASFDTVVFSLALCTIPDDRAAIAEAVRVLRPGGQVRIVEHVRSPNLAVRAVQHLLDPLSRRFQADHLLREPLDLVTAAGLVAVEQRRWALGFFERIAAVKPDEG